MKEVIEVEEKTIRDLACKADGICHILKVFGEAARVIENSVPINAAFYDLLAEEVDEICNKLYEVYNNTPIIVKTNNTN